MTERSRTRDIAVTGGGIAALAAAIAFRRALPDTTVVLFSGEDVGPEYPGAAAPYIHRFHELVGIPPELFRSRAGAWAVEESEIVLHGAAPFRFLPLAEVPHVEGAALHQLWLRRTVAGVGPSWPDVAQRVRAEQDRAFGPEVRFDAEAYRALLAELASRIGVTGAEGVADSPALSEDFDLVVDARPAGPDAAGWRPLDGVPAQVEWRFGPAASRGGNRERLRVEGDHVLWENAAWSAEGSVVEGAPVAGRVLNPMRDGILRVGRAAVECETFDGQPLTVALAGLVRALGLLPRPRTPGLEAGEYNRRSGIVHDFLLDWAAVRWAREAEAPEGLAMLREQFAHRGRIPFRDEDPIPAGHWIAWFLGRGERPAHVDLTAMTMPEDRLYTLFAQF